MWPVEDVRQLVQDAVDLYTGPTFKDCIPVDRGYHLVRALDELVYNGWFKPWNAQVSYVITSWKEIIVNITDYQPVKFTITIKKDDHVIATH